MKTILILLINLVVSVNLVAAPKNPKAEPSALYRELHLKEAGLSEAALQFALIGYEKLKQEGKLKNPGLLTIVDFSQPSTHKRLYIIDLENNKVVLNTYVAHGKNTGVTEAVNFSNSPGSFQSSLGFYVTENPIISPKHGKALLLEGQEKGINDMAKKREIIIHGASYVKEEFISKNGYLGRSHGCPAVPEEETEKIVELLSGGSCLFVFHPNQDYLKKSSLLH